MIHDHHRMLDWLAGALALVAGAGFWHGVSVAVTILAGIGSLSLIGLRWHDRIKYGPARGKE